MTKVTYFDEKVTFVGSSGGQKGVPLGFSKLFQKIYPRARFELPSRRHCSEKLGAVALLYFMDKKGNAMTQVTFFDQKVYLFDQLLFLTQKSIFPIQFCVLIPGQIVVWDQNP